VPETYRLRLIAAAAGSVRAHRLGWSCWRRTQQARAQRAHTRHRAPAAPPPPAVPFAVVAVPGTPALTPAAWATIVPLLPATAPRGRPRRDAAQVLAGILWVMHTGAPWRAIPSAYGPWRTCHDRHRRWREDGTWDRIYAVLCRPIPLDKQLLL